MTGRDRGARSPLHERVDAFSRYAELATAQLAALDEADLATFARLAAAREELAAEIDAGPDLATLVADAGGRASPSGDPDPASETGGIAPGVAALLGRARLALGEGEEATRAIEQRLLGLRDETRAAIAALEGRLPALRQYLETEGAGAGGLDIRL